MVLDTLGRRPVFSVHTDREGIMFMFEKRALPLAERECYKSSGLVSPLRFIPLALLTVALSIGGGVALRLRLVAEQMPVTDGQ
jgi:hypothetical protein